MVLDLNQTIKRFRLASRELFNNYFAEPASPSDYLYEFYDGFDAVENVLFQMLVLEPSEVGHVVGYSYGDPHPNIRVRCPIANAGEDLTGCDDPIALPIMLNTEISSGYWDYPLGA